MDGLKDIGINLGTTIGKQVLVSELRKKGRKLVEKDTNKTGSDDFGGQTLLAVADAVEAIEFTENPKSLMNIGRAFEAAGKRIQEEAKKAGVQ
ncbi:MAG: hypothetical protein KG003_07625 [Bacteroidetes bacterium]|nr:hypothetical protein [Bacteroidota bacterium]